MSRIEKVAVNAPGANYHKIDAWRVAKSADLVSVRINETLVMILIWALDLKCLV